MDHETVVREKITERYLLNELDSTARDQFEEHFFDCADCAFDVRSAAEFLSHSNVVLAETSDSTSVPITTRNPSTDRGRRFAWLYPALLVPVMVLLLAVIGYQNFVTLPRLQSALQPHILPWAVINTGTWGEGKGTITISPGSNFLLFVRIPPDSNYAHYAVGLIDPQGRLVSNLEIPSMPDRDQFPLEIPGKDRESGTYVLIVHGVNGQGEVKEISKTSFKLKIEK